MAVINHHYGFAGGEPSLSRASAQSTYAPVWPAQRRWTSIGERWVTLIDEMVAHAAGV